MNYEPLGQWWDPLFTGIKTTAEVGTSIWHQIQQSKLAIQQAQTEQQRIAAQREYNRLMAEQAAKEEKEKESTKKLLTYGGLAAGTLLTIFAFTQ